MQVDLKGRINNVPLSLSRALFPLFEAIVNSIHAVEELNNGNGSIEVLIERDDTQTLIDPTDYELNPIKNFVVIDNGIGFDSKNYESFLTADTTLKANKGAKGIGRFLWLKAFDRVRIESFFNNNGNFYKRSFNFLLSEEGVEDHELTEVSIRERKTSVKLFDFVDKYRTACPSKTDAIALRIIEHALVYFLSKNCPQIFLVDGNKKLNLNKIFEEKIKLFSKVDTFNIRSKQFEITHLKLSSSEENRHQIHFCADNREVRHENLSNYIPDLNKKLKDESGHFFIYQAYISSKYLNARVNPERTDFNLPDDNCQLFEDEIYKGELIKGVTKNIKDHLKDYLNKVKDEKIKRVENFIQVKAPQYKPILKYKDEYLDEISSDLTDEKLDIELYKISSKIELKLKKKSREILKTDIKNVRDIEKYKVEYKKFIEDVNEFGKSRLAQYIIHRKLIMDLLSKKLEFDADSNKYSLEESIHEIIFPLRTTSEDIDYERQNLWIIDEKLSYHKYLASDIPLNKFTPVIVTDSQRPDIIIFNSPFAFVDDNPPFSSVVIIEFKRPCRSDYSEEKDNPISQIYDYVRKIKGGKVPDSLPDTFS